MCAGAGGPRAAVQGQRYRRHYRLSAGGPDRCTSARGGSLRGLWQGGEIPLGRPSIWRLHFLCLPFGGPQRPPTAPSPPVLDPFVLHPTNPTSRPPPPRPPRIPPPG